MALFSPKGLFLSSVVLALGLVAVGTLVTMSSLKRIGEMERVSRELDDREVRFTSRFRALVFRLQSLVLRSQFRFDQRFKEEFVAQRAETERFLEERRDLFSTEAETHLYKLLIKRLGIFCGELEKMLESGGVQQSPQDSLAALRESLAAANEDLSKLGAPETVIETKLHLHQVYSAAVGALLDRRDAMRETFRNAAKDAVDAQELLVGSLSGSPPPNITPAVLKNRLEAAAGRVARFLALAETVVASAQTVTDPREQLERFEAFGETRDSLLELAIELGASRREAFKAQLDKYHASAESLRSRSLIFLALFLASLLGAGFLAYRAFIVPMRGRLDTAEESVRHHGNLVTMGTLASGIAHEIRNPLTAIKARLFALQELLDKPSPAESQANVIGSEIGRLERIVQEFLDYARPKEPNLAPTDLQSFFEDLRDLALPDLRTKGVEFCLGDPVDARLRIDREQIQQILLNLIRNAADACPSEGGKVTLSASPRPGGGHRLTVTDNGSGIPADYRERVFEPFFSKKKGGTGLGLPICQVIARSHRGDLFFETTEGEGTSFHLDLP